MGLRGRTAERKALICDIIADAKLLMAYAIGDEDDLAKSMTISELAELGEALKQAADAVSDELKSRDQTHPTGKVTACQI